MSTYMRFFDLNPIGINDFQLVIDPKLNKVKFIKM
jgi:hypothetical protein